MIVWQMLAALGMGAILGAGGVSWWVWWMAPRPPALRAKPRRLSRRAYRRLVKAYRAKQGQPARFVDEHGPELTDLPPGQVLNRLPYDGPYVGERPDPFELVRDDPPPVHTLGGERGSSADGRVRYTYIRGPVRGRDHE